MKQNWLNGLVRGLILIGMGVIALVPLLPLLMDGAEGYEYIFSVMRTSPAYIASAILVIVALIGCEMIALTLYRMMLSLKQNPFCQENVKALRLMGFMALGVSLLGLGTICFVPVPLAVLGSLPIGMCGLFSLVLERVFRQAVAYKEENELTI